MVPPEWDEHIFGLNLSRIHLLADSGKSCGSLVIEYLYGAGEPVKRQKSYSNPEANDLTQLALVQIHAQRCEHLPLNFIWTPV